MKEACIELPVWDNDTKTVRAQNPHPGLFNDAVDFFRVRPELPRTCARHPAREHHGGLDTNSVQLLYYTRNGVRRSADNSQIGWALQLAYFCHRRQAINLFIALTVNRLDFAFVPCLQEVSDNCTAKTALPVRCTNHSDRLGLHKAFKRSGTHQTSIGFLCLCQSRVH